MTTTEVEKGFEEIRELFTGQWGEVIDSLGKNGIIEALQKRGIELYQLFRQIKNRKNGREMEVDFLLANETELVVGAVKTTMRVEDVREFLNELNQFLTFFPIYKNFKIYGAMIGIKIEEKADMLAYRSGLFVFKVGGEGMLRILNDSKFQPVDFRKPQENSGSTN